MSKKEGSVAPKERINIKYRPATGDAQEDVELPLKMVMVGDYTLREDDTPLEDRKPINVDKDNFNDVLKAQNLSLNLNVKDTLTKKEGKEGDPDSELSLKLNFEKFEDFKPDKVIHQVPEMEKLLELRKTLVALKGPLGNVPSFRRKIQALLDEDEEARNKLLNDIIKSQGE